MSHTFLNPFSICTIFEFTESSKLFGPFLDQYIKSFWKDNLKLFIQFRNPNVEVRYIFFTEIINNLLDHLNFFIEDVFFQWAIR